MTERDTQGGPRRPGDKRSPEEIEAQIHETKSAIGEDIKALGERLSPEHLREGAKAVMHDAREEAKGLLRDVTDGAADTLRHAKDRAVDTLRHAKDNAVDTVTEVADEVGTVARRAGTRTAEFVTTNGVPLTLIGLGVGWLALSMRRQRAQVWDGRREYGDGPSRRMRAEANEPSMYDRAPIRSQSRSRPEAGDREGPGSESLMERAEEGFDSARDRVKQVAEQVEHRAEDLGHRAMEAGREVRSTVGHRLERVRTRAADYSQENPVALGAVAMVAGVGVGLLLPTTELERQWMGRASSRLVDEARGTAERVGDRAKSTAREVRDVISDAL